MSKAKIFLRELRCLIDSNVAGSVLETQIKRSLVDFKNDDGDPIVQQINLEYSGIYSKASSLLTHVSMMIAALSFIFDAIEGRILRVFILINLICYLVSLLFILRVIWVPAFPEADLERRRQLLAEELILSQRYLRLAHLLAVCLTVMVIILLLAHLI